MPLTLVLDILMEDSIELMSLTVKLGVYGAYMPKHTNTQSKKNSPKPISRVLRMLVIEEDNIKYWQISGFPGGKAKLKQLKLELLSLLNPPMILAILTLSNQLPRMLVQKN
ncbi:hypothetical protein E2I00_009122 [Balaenoptera physalus]|uniref:Uncharacterized protein n=1 Tax=Balaenoptera physalus TaxID=9770 RepID=A0A643CHI9_BALPH|nr:hypothetical protein E2I00_009122 [Balaenoptera physalus]